MTENWGVRSRLSGVGLSLLATAPVWPVLQPREPIADEMLAPAEVLVVVPVVLVFPVAWALLGRTERAGRLFSFALTLLVLVFSSWAAEFGEYATPPNLDDGLRWYLLTAAAAAATGVVREAGKIDHRWVAGCACWVLGIAVTLMVPVLDDRPVPPEDIVLPLTPVTAGLAGQSECGEAGPLVDPYQLCVDFRLVGQHIEGRFGYANKHDPIY